MSFHKLPYDLIYEIAKHLVDPCDLKAFLKVDKQTYANVTGIFSQRVQYRHKNFRRRIWSHDRFDLYLYPTGPDFESDDARDAFAREFYNLLELLFEAVVNGWLRLAKAAFKRGATVYSENYSITVDAIHTGNPEILALVLDNGAEISRHALHIAAKIGEFGVSKLLIERGCLVDEFDFNNPNCCTPLTDACMALGPKSKRAYLDVCKLLLENGADPNVFYDFGNEGPELPSGPAAMAVRYRNNDILSLLLSYDAYIFVKTDPDPEDHTDPGLIDDGLKTGSESVAGHGSQRLGRHKGDSLLHLAISRFVEFKTADTGEQAQGAPVPVSADWGSMEILCYHDIGIVNAQNSEGVTALHLAAFYGLSFVVIYLLDHHASPSIKDRRGKMARDWARERGHEKTYVLLTRKKALYGKDS